MALWRHFQSICLLNNSPEKLLEIYSLPSDELILCLRVGFADWIESSISKISPTNFIRGLQFHVRKALRGARTEANAASHLHNQKSLSRYKRFLARIKPDQDFKTLYIKFVKCLSAEYTIVRDRNMESELDLGICRFVEVQETNLYGDEKLREIDNIRANIPLSIRNLQRLEAGVNELINNLRRSFETYFHWYNEYNMGCYQQPVDTLIAVAPLAPMMLLDEAGDLLKIKTCLETKVKDIHDTVASMITNLRRYLHQYERLHVFSQRAVNFEHKGIVEMGNFAEEIIKFLTRISSSLLSCHNEFDFRKILSINHDVIVRRNAYEEKRELMTISLYQTNFESSRIDFHKLILDLYQAFALVVDCQPPMVIKTNQKKAAISLRIFNLNNIFANAFKIRVCLVNESTVKKIRESNVLSDDICPVGKIILADYRSSDSNTITRCRPNKPTSAPRRKRRPPSEANQVGSTEVILEGEWAPNDKCRVLEKEFIITYIERDPKTSHQVEPGSKGDKAPSRGKSKPGTSKDSATAPGVTNLITDQKVALLFVTELMLSHQEKLMVWTVSLPIVVAAHGSQNQKAWITAAWDEVLASPNRPGFEVEKFANWAHITQMLKGTFEVMVNDSLKPSHLLYLRQKAEQSLGPSFAHNITKEALSDDKDDHISYWLWFYRNALVVKENGHFNDAWKKGYIEGYIDYQGATDLLRNSHVQKGTFLVRFSDTEPGSLTLVFLAFDGKFYKMQPIEVYKTKSKHDCALALLTVLNVKESTQGKEAFLRVYPNICKTEAFKTLYAAIAKNTKVAGKIPTGYVKISNMLPLHPSQTNNDESAQNALAVGSIRNVSSGSESDAAVSNEARSGEMCVDGDLNESVPLNESEVLTPPFETMEVVGGIGDIDVDALMYSVFGHATYC